VNLKARNHLKDLAIDGRIRLKVIFKKQNGRAWTGLILLRIRGSVWPL
jgi:hypothetical protein